jgi:triacylglycerol esterase/lipase EstA (alpha/beta hydrolase family)
MHRLVRVVRGALALVVAAVTVTAAAASASATPASAVAPDHGYDDWGCRPSAAHPEPVVLIHGLGVTGNQNWDSFDGPRLAAAGYCTFELTYGVLPGGSPGGWAPIAQSSQEITAFVDRVLATTGAARVDLVGHSEGALQALYVTKVLHYAPKVHRVVALAPPTHGTTVSGLPILPLEALFGCAACLEVLPGGSAVQAVDTGPIAQPGVDYTIIATRFDVIVTPADTGFVPEPGVHNRWVQDTCPLDPVGHAGLGFDSGVTTMITNALDPTTPTPVPCTLGPPL